MNPTMIFFFILAATAVLSALGMLFSRNAIIAAMMLISNFLAVAILYLILEAPFIAVAQVAVYTGAIMVLFLFAIMLLGAEQVGVPSRRWWLQPIALVLGAVLMAELIYIIIRIFDMPTTNAALPEGFGSPLAVGETLFLRYVLPFEATSILLLIAMIGAIVLTRVEKK
jgi:NADH-quinone oxidoreductase subunit J